MPWSRMVPLVAVFSTAMMGCTPALAERMDSYEIANRGTADLKYPAWFKESFLDLRDDLKEAQAAGKRGVIIFFSQKACQHCQAFLDTTLQEADIKEKLQKQYDVIGLDIFNDVEVTGIDASKMPIKDFAEAERARFTPTLVFYGVEQQRLLRIVGFYPPEKFRKVLAYIDGDHFKNEKLSEYMLRTSTRAPAQRPVLTADHGLFAKPPYDLQRAAAQTQRPLLVVFDRGGCAACERFRERVLQDDQVRALLRKYYAVQLDRTDDASKLIDPKGRAVTAQQWARELELAYGRSILFFDNKGEEVHRLDSEVGRWRVIGSMEFVLAQGYKKYTQYQRWRREQVQQEKNR